MDADAFGQFAVRGVAQQQHAAAGDHGRVSLGDVELLEQTIHVRVGLNVHPGEQRPIFGQEIADTEGVGRVPRSDHSQAGEVCRLAQELPAGDECLEDDVAQSRTLVQCLPERVP